MRKFTVDDHVIEAADAADLVRKMAANSLAQAESPEAWMEDAAYRFNLISGKDIRCDTAEAFVTDLLNAGLIEVGSPPPRLDDDKKNS
jgi:hypothetical protein